MSRARDDIALERESSVDASLSPQYFLDVIQDLGTLLAAIYDRRTGLTRNQTRMVIELLRHDGQTQTELANALSIHKVSVGIYVAELEAMGLVERRTHPTDGRAKCIFLTSLLHATKHVGENHYAAIHGAAIEGVARKDYLTMLNCLERMRDNLSKLDTHDREKRRA